jgi:hypothetical protein
MKLISLKTPQYENCEVLSPEGQLMFRCCRKKALWYLDRNLGKKIIDDPLTVQLTFVPKGAGHIDDPYFLQKMENRCVVCGSEEFLTRHHIVPYCYRKFFPDQLKNHRSYDVMALCIPCHRSYEEHALELKEILANQHSAPISGTGIKYDKELARARGAAAALLTNRHKMPPERQEELLSRVKTYLKKEITDVDMQELVDKDPYDFGNYTHHGKIVIEQITDIEVFVQEWRQHFIYKMQPQFLPSHWTVYRPVDHK